MVRGSSGCQALPAASGRHGIPTAAGYRETSGQEHRKNRCDVRKRQPYLDRHRVQEVQATGDELERLAQAEQVDAAMARSGFHRATTTTPRAMKPRPLRHAGNEPSGRGHHQRRSGETGEGVPEDDGGVSKGLDIEAPDSVACGRSPAARA